MNTFEVHQMKYFDDQETFCGTARVIDWATFNATAMFAMDRLRDLVGSPIYILRGPHPNRPEAVDACCPGRSLKEVFMQMCRLQGVSWGVYSGNSFHIDARPFVGVPARWFAVHSDESAAVVAVGCPVAYSAPIPNSTKGWEYFDWDHAKAFDGLAVCCSIADRMMGKVARGDV